jgi:hypothetical protein
MSSAQLAECSVYTDGFAGLGLIVPHPDTVTGSKTLEDWFGVSFSIRRTMGAVGLDWKQILPSGDFHVRASFSCKKAGRRWPASSDEKERPGCGISIFGSARNFDLRTLIVDNIQANQVGSIAARDHIRHDRFSPAAIVGIKDKAWLDVIRQAEKDGMCTCVAHPITKKTFWSPVLEIEREQIYKLQGFLEGSGEITSGRSRLSPAVIVKAINSIRFLQAALAAAVDPTIDEQHQWLGNQENLKSLEDRYSVDLEFQKFHPAPVVAIAMDRAVLSGPPCSANQDSCRRSRRF